MSHKGACVPAPKRLCLWPLTAPSGTEPALRAWGGRGGGRDREQAGVGGVGAAQRPGQAGSSLPDSPGAAHGVQDPGGPCCPAGRV